MSVQSERDFLIGELALLASEAVIRLRPLFGDESFTECAAESTQDGLAIGAEGVTKMPAWQSLKRVARYALDRVAASRTALPTLRDDIGALETLLELSVTPVRILAWKQMEVREVMHAEVGDQAFDTQLPRPHRYRGAVKEVVQLAKSHLAVDMDSRLTLPDIARLARLKESSVMSAAQRGLFVTEEINGRRTAAPSDVLSWILERGFQRTLFEDDLNYQMETSMTSDKDKAFWVPVADDGSKFTPSCRREKGYEIGPKGHEQYVESFDEALQRLQEDWKNAHWRRPNSKGNWGSVAAVRWETIKLAG